MTTFRPFFLPLYLNVAIELLRNRTILLLECCFVNLGLGRSSNFCLGDRIRVFLQEVIVRSAPVGVGFKGRWHREVSEKRMLEHLLRSYSTFGIVHQYVSDQHFSLFGNFDVLVNPFELEGAAFDFIVGLFAAFGLEGRYSQQHRETTWRTRYIITPIAQRSTSKAYSFFSITSGAM